MFVPLPATPPEAVGEVYVERVEIGRRVFYLRRPADPDRLLDHPATLAAFQRDEYMPYWCDLWPAARMLAEAILDAEWPADVAALELGCGLGLPGIAALSKGLRVTFSDYDSTALEYAATNARLNGYYNFELLAFDWRSPPIREFPVILAADLIYEERNVLPIVEAVSRLLAKGGMCLLTDQDRRPAARLRELLPRFGLSFSVQRMHAGQPPGPGNPQGRRVAGTLYRIQWSAR